MLTTLSAARLAADGSHVTRRLFQTRNATSFNWRVPAARFFGIPGKSPLITWVDWSITLAMSNNERLQTAVVPCSAWILSSQRRPARSDTL